MADLQVFDTDPNLYLYTSLTAGSSHIVTATSRIETILRANKIPFKGVDTATDDLARKLYQRRGSGKKLPLLVKQGYVVGDLEMIEEWNEYGELKDALGVTSAPVKPVQAVVMPSQAPPKSTTPATAAAANQKENIPAQTPAQNLAIRQMGAEAAKVAASKKATPTKISTTNPLLAEKINSPLSAGASTPKKGTAGLDSILSPKSIPLPATPSTATSKAAAVKPEPKKEEEEESSEEEDDDDDDDDEEEESEEEEDGPPRLPPATNQKPITLPIRSKGELDNPALNAGPISVTHKSPSPLASPTGGQGGKKSSNGADVEDKTKEESSEEEDDDDDDDDDEEDEEEDEEGESEEEESEEESDTAKPKEPTGTPKPEEATTKEATKTEATTTKPAASKSDKSSKTAKTTKTSSSSTSKSKSKTSEKTTDKAKKKVKTVVKAKDSSAAKTSSKSSSGKAATAGSSSKTADKEKEKEKTKKSSNAKK